MYNQRVSVTHTRAPQYCVTESVLQILRGCCQCHAVVIIQFVHVFHIALLLYCYCINKWWWLRVWSSASTQAWHPAGADRVTGLLRLTTLQSTHISVTIFTALHGMQTRSSDRNSVWLSVRQTRALWQNGRKLCFDFYIIRKNIYPSFVFWEGEWLVGAIPSTWNVGPTGPRWSEIADFEPIIARSASAVTPSEKVLTDWQTDRQTDANRFYNLSHAICYSYGTDNNSFRRCIVLVWGIY